MSAVSETTKNRFSEPHYLVHSFEMPHWDSLIIRPAVCFPTDNYPSCRTMMENFSPDQHPFLSLKTFWSIIKNRGYCFEISLAVQSLCMWQIRGLKDGDRTCPDLGRATFIPISAALLFCDNVTNNQHKIIVNQGATMKRPSTARAIIPIASKPKWYGETPIKTEETL